MTKKRRRPRRTTALNIRGLNVDLKANFKAYCARRDYTMADALAALMQMAVTHDLNLPIPYKKKVEGE